jgi:hypothetical protein
MVVAMFSSCSCNDSRKENTVVQSTVIDNVAACEDYILENKTNNLNISILLDLSDRIDLPQQQIKDSAYILSLAKSFNNHIKGKKLGLLYDKMELFFEPTPSDDEINILAKQLKIGYVKGVSKKEWMPKTLERYSTIPTKIYELARMSSKGKEYPGSDIWNFFKYQVKDYCINECYRNILVILTDGYMYYDKSMMKQMNKTSYLTPNLLAQLNLNRPDWKEEMEKKNLGFIPATYDLDNLEVLVLGIQSNNETNPYTHDILHFYWENWLKEMGVKESNIKLKNADIPASMEKVIFDFILNK